VLSLEQSLQQRLPGARLETVRAGEVNLQLLAADFPRAPLPGEVARAIWDHPPYWAFCWPAGGWLSQWLPGQPCGGPVVDLGCGSGILSIAMALRGHRVLAVDSDPEARLATASNARLNGVQFPILSSLEEIQESCSLLVLADFLYDPANLEELRQLRGFCPNIVVADCRLQNLPEDFVEIARVQQRILPDLDWGHEFENLIVARTRQ
jgi:predicted nicotinamide N-methyase